MRRTTISHFSFLISNSSEAFIHNQGGVTPLGLTLNLEPDLSFAAADAGVDGQDDIRHIGEVAALQHFDEGRDIAVRRGAETESLEVLGAISLDIVDGFAARLLDAGEKFTLGRDAADRRCDRAFREIFERA